MTTLSERLAQLRGLVEVATQGPWETDSVGIYGCTPDEDDSIMLASVYADGGLEAGEHVANAALIVAMRNSFKALVAVAEAAQEMHSFALANALDQAQWDEASDHPMQRFETALASLSEP